MLDYSKNLAWQMSHPDIELSCYLDYDPASIWLIPTLNEHARNLPFYVQEVGRTIAGEKYYVGRKNLDSFEIACILSGGIDFTYNGQSFTSNKDTVVWLDCRYPHTFRSEAQSKAVDCYFVHFWGDGAIRYHEFFKSICPAGLVNFKSTERIIRYLKRLISIYSTDSHTPLKELAACTYLSNICLEMIENVQPKSDAEPSEPIRNIKKYLDTNYTEKITLDDLAEKCFMSKSYLQKQFKKYYGCSPNDYLLQTRLIQAKILLRNTNKSINTIAVEVGFDTPSYFISVFSKKEGITPLSYRMMWALK